MAAKKKPNALDFARAYLKKKPKAPFADVRDAAKKKKLVLYPISYGRAQALEGIVKVAKYGSKKAAKKKAAKKKGAKKTGRGPGRPQGRTNSSRPGRTAGCPTTGQ